MASNQAKAGGAKASPRAAIAAAPPPFNEPAGPNGQPPVHPGKLLAGTILPDLKKKGIPKVQVAAALGVSRRTLEDLVLQRQACTPEMALRLSKYLRGSPEFWLNLQRAWDLARAREKIADQLAAIEPLSEEVIRG